jgi:hypothetical protein
MINAGALEFRYIQNESGLHSPSPDLLYPPNDGKYDVSGKMPADRTLLNACKIYLYGGLRKH